MMKELLSEDFYSKFFDKMLDWVIDTIPALLLVTVIFVISYWGCQLVLRKAKKFIIKKIQSNIKSGSKTKINLEREKQANTLIGIIRGVLLVSMWGLYILIFLKQIGVNIAPILTGAGIIGLAVGFGGQELVRDAISGFFILLENHVRVGDVVVVNGTGGLVEKINLRTITLRDLSGVVHVYQNGKINTLSNMTKDWSAMVFDIGVDYKENIDEVSIVIKKVGDELRQDPVFCKNILEPIEIFGLDKFADSAIIIKARIKTTPIQQWSVGREFNRRLKIAFNKHKIQIPFPHRTIYWGKETDPTLLKKAEELSNK